jgi:hypothetical protein
VKDVTHFNSSPITFPTLRGEAEPSSIFPNRWIKMGLIGQLLDLVERLGYVAGAALVFSTQMEISQHRIKYINFHSIK